MKKVSKIILACATLLAAMSLVSCEKKQVLKLYSWTYYTPTDVVKAFEEEFNCKVVVTEYDSNETMFNKLINGGAKSFDIVVPSQDYVSILMAKNMLQPIDQNKFTNRNKINPKIIEKISYDPDMIISISNADVLIIMENIAKSSKFEISEQMKFISEKNSQIIGAVIR